jgi:hypothetical protein
MKWVKKGLVFAPDRQFDWMVSHAAVPVADDLSKDELRLYFGTRDARGRSQLARIDVAADAPHSVHRVHDRPVLPLGNPGTFDDNGIMPASMVSYDGRKYLYYIGWNPQVTVPYRLAIGLAVSEDDGRTFVKASEGPVADRGFEEPYFNTAPSVLVDGRVWRMWYVSCTGWVVVDGRPEPRYHIKYAESADGVRWRKTGRVCIDYDERTEAIGRPCVYREDGAYRMLYSYRSIRAYRTDPAQSYRLGYAESADGLSWTRRDDEVGIGRSADGWDSEMIEYATVHDHGHERYLFYNGNGFGRTGVGYAVRER